jgi:hypothetical protein
LDPGEGRINCKTNKEAWRKKKRTKKGEIKVKVKKESMEKFINNLCPKSNATKTWAFAKAWINETRAPDLNCSPMKDSDTKQIVTPNKEIVRILSRAICSLNSLWRNHL